MTASATASAAVLQCLQTRALREQLAVAALARIEGAVATRAMTRPADADVAVMQAVLDELDRRGATGASDLELQADVRLLHGRFDEAEAIARRTPTLATAELPATKPLGGAVPHDAARAWRLDADGVLREQTLDLAHGIVIVVDASPDCEFCIPAARWLDASPDLGPVFHAHSIWISRPDTSRLGGDMYAAWNRAHPALPMYAITDVRGWPMPEAWSTPRFVVLRDGHRVDEVLGWTARSPQQLRTALARAGLALPPRATDAPVPTPFDPDPGIAEPAHARAQAALRAKRLNYEARLAMAPVRTRAQLDAYLQRHPIGSTPFAPLSTASRERLLGALVFDPQGGMIGSPFRDVEAELSFTQAWRLLALFGREDDIARLPRLRVDSDDDRLLRDWAEANGE